MILHTFQRPTARESAAIDSAEQAPLRVHSEVTSMYCRNGHKHGHSLLSNSAARLIDRAAALHRTAHHHKKQQQCSWQTHEMYCQRHVTVSLSLVRIYIHTQKERLTAHSLREAAVHTLLLHLHKHTALQENNSQPPHRSTTPQHLLNL